MILVFNKSLQTKTLKCVNKSTFKVYAYSVNPLSFTCVNKADITLKTINPKKVNDKGFTVNKVYASTTVSRTFICINKAKASAVANLIHTKKVYSKNNSDIHLNKRILINVKANILGKSTVNVNAKTFASPAAKTFSLKTRILLKAKTAQSSEIHVKGKCSLTPHKPKVAISKVSVIGGSHIRIQKYNKRYKG